MFLVYNLAYFLNTLYTVEWIILAESYCIYSLLYIIKILIYDFITSLSYNVFFIKCSMLSLFLL